MPYCPHCRQFVETSEPKGAAMCSACGVRSPLEPAGGGAEGVCPACRAVYCGDALYCPEDGQALLPVEQAAAVCTRCSREYSFHTYICALDGAEVVVQWRDYQDSGSNKTGDPVEHWEPGPSRLGFTDVVMTGIARLRSSHQNYLRYGLRVLLICIGLLLGSAVLAAAFGETGLAVGSVSILYYGARFGIALTHVALRQASGRSVRYEDFFVKHPPVIMRTTLSYLLLMSLVAAGGVFNLGLWTANLVLSVGSFFFLPVVVDQRLTLWPALAVSFARTYRYLPEVLGLAALAGLANALGVIPLGAGMIVSIPFTVCLCVAAYARACPDKMNEQPPS